MYSTIRGIPRDRQPCSIVGTGEVWLALRLLGSAVGWSDALLLESLGPAVRSAFAIRASQEGGYLPLPPLVALPPDVALGLSWAFRRPPAAAASD